MSEISRVQKATISKFKKRNKRSSNLSKEAYLIAAVMQDSKIRNIKNVNQNL